MSQIPTHLGLISDGNRRWAKAKGLSSFEGHEKGGEVLQEIALKAFSRGVKFVSAYVFSRENWARTEQEVGFLMKLVADAAGKYLDKYHQAGIKILVIGRRERLASEVLESIERSEQKTLNNTKGTLVLCFNYGGHEEIVDAAKKLSDSHAEITAESLGSTLYAADVPPVDLIIRTSGEQRLSGFMLWRAAYAELKFVDKNWPDFTEADLDEALADYAARQRRFGS